MECVHAAFDVGDAFVAEGGEVFAGFCGAHAGFAVDDDLGVFGEVGGVGGEGLEGDELGLGDVDDVPFFLFADVEEEGVEVVCIEAGFELCGGDGLHGGVWDGAGGFQISGLYDS